MRSIKTVAPAAEARTQAEPLANAVEVLEELTMSALNGDYVQDFNCKPKGERVTMSTQRSFRQGKALFSKP